MPSERSLANLKRPWQKGESGNPAGARKRKPFGEALIAALEAVSVEGGPTNAEVIAEKLIERLKVGDRDALKVLGLLLDRAEGPVKQSTSVDLSGTISLVPWDDD